MTPFLARYRLPPPSLPRCRASAAPAPGVASDALNSMGRLLSRPVEILIERDFEGRALAKRERAHDVAGLRPAPYVLRETETVFQACSSAIPKR